MFVPDPPSWPLLDPEILEAIERAFQDGSWGRYHGPHVEALEASLVHHFQVPHAVTCASGTLAVEVALRAAGVQPGDEVILAAYDYEPNFLTIHHLAATPVLVDVFAHNAAIDFRKLPEVITPKTRAILVSHLHGGLVDMVEVRKIADHYHIAVIEDAAQAPGAAIAGLPVGSWGDYGILSFGGSKLLSAGRGGAILTRTARNHQRVKFHLSRGIQQWAPLSELQALVLLPQLEKLGARNLLRSQAVERLRLGIQEIPGIRRFENSSVEGAPAYYKVGFFFDPDRMGCSRQDFVCRLRSEGIAFDEGFRALHIGRGKNRYRAVGELAVAALAHEQVVMLHHPVLLLGNDEVDKVVGAIEKTYRNSQRPPA